MKFSEMPYTRPDTEALKQQMQALTDALKTAPDYETARALFLQQQELEKHLSTAGTLVEIRHSIDTRDAFYEAESDFFNAAMPELQEYEQNWTAALLQSPFRADFEKDYGSVMFLNAELGLKTFSPEIIPELQQENDLVTAYDKLIASAQIPFEGKTYTVAQLGVEGRGAMVQRQPAEAG